MSSRIRRSVAAVALFAPLAALAFATPASADEGHGEGRAGTIYTETNNADGNAVLALRNVDGNLTNVGSYATGGRGSGDGLGSQGVLVADHNRLLAVNAGSNEVSLFSIGDNGRLTLRDVESSGGIRPVSVTVHDNVAYVVNAGDRTVSGFRIGRHQIEPIPGSTRTLPGNGAAQISFDTDGDRLVITEKATSTIDVLAVNDRGVAGVPVSNASTGETPFGFAIDRRDHVIVSNAAGGAAGASSLSSYSFAGKTGLVSVSAAVADTQAAACWVALSDNQKYAYTTNTGSGSISSYRVGRDGSLTLINAVAAQPGAAPSDMVTTEGTLFALSGGSHTITSHDIAADGSLSAVSQISVPTGVAGLAAA
ncbi:MAG: beta-propeller fold lactonase family protein [Acidimicrobiales bacterium]